MIAENVCKGTKAEPIESRHRSRRETACAQSRPTKAACSQKWVPERLEATGPERSPSARPEAIARRARYCVHESGRGAIAGIDVGEAETEAFWRQVLKPLIATSRPQRGSADAHAGRKAAIVRHLHFPW
jgi:hypothetical protein